MVFVEGGEGRCFLSVDDGGDAWPCADGGYIFAPTAIDILEQLGWEFYLLFDQTTPQWICNQPNNEIGIWTDQNPHEAAAKAYLQLHKPA